MKSKGKILLIDDDKTFQTVTKSVLEEEGFSVEVATSTDEGEALLQRSTFDLILTDLVMPGKGGLDVLEYVKRWCPETPVIMITGFATIHSAVEAMKAGAEDYLTKPCSNEELVVRIKKVLEKRWSQQELSRLREEVSEKYTFSNMVGKSSAMQAVFSLIRQVADTDVTVLIQGETGTGKELIARAIHYNSPRRHKPFISVNCVALSETLLESELFGHEKGAFTGAIKQKLGRFELAHGGTLFLDELSDIPLSTQAKLLRVLQEREFERVGGTETIKTDIRIIAATNKNLKKSIAEGTFREDLYYRLNVVPIVISPLRERKEDIPLLANHFLKQYNEKFSKKIHGFTASAMEILLAYSWPGNVRELENTIERAVVLCNQEVIDVNHLIYLNQESENLLLNQALQQHMTEAQLTKLYARMVLNEMKGNKKEACRILGINFRTLQTRLKD
ncbi:MAG: sigma-54-dependent Fis family transcriptional regulator [Calditrichaeota bacterium]|nr:MAG: sigma-54-dependent Fis family transcriptional regulator [Calditrichota bacterium]